MGMTQTGTLTFTRTGRQIGGTIIRSMSVYTLVRSDDGKVHRLRTDRLAEGTETERGHISFKADR